MQDFIPRKIDINQSIDTITVKQFDHLSRFLHFRIIDEDLSENGEKLPLNLSMCRARLYVEAGDESCAFIDGEIADGEDGIVTFLLPNGITQTAGDFRCEIWLSDPEEHSIISSKIFNLRVEESLRKDSEIEATDQFSVLANALQFADTAELRISALESSSIRLDGYKMDGTFHTKPLYIGDINGWAAQSIVYIDEGLYLIGFSSLADDNASKLVFFQEDDNPKNSSVIGEVTANYKHVNSIARDSDGVFYTSPASSKVKRFTLDIDVENSTVSLTELEEMAMENGITVKDVFGCGGDVYAYGEINGTAYYWNLLDSDAAPVAISLPDELPRVSQAWVADGTYLYWLCSNPNTIAIFDFSTGDFIRWVHVGDFAGGTLMIGEIEALCFANGRMKMVSQFHYPNPATHSRRFWLFSELFFAKDAPLDQLHSYPNELKRIFVSNETEGSTGLVTNKGESIAGTEQAGTINNPYPTLEMALYAAMATPRNAVKIIMNNTGTAYTIDDLELRLPGLSAEIVCNGKTVFENLCLYDGSLTVTGSGAEFKRLTVGNNASFRSDSSTFSASGRINDTAPYILSGKLAIVNAKYTGDSTAVIIEFQSGATGVVGFTEGTPYSNNYKQLNLRMYNVKNAGIAEYWVPLYTGGSLSVGNAIPLSQPIKNGAMYRVRWRTRDSHAYTTTLVSVNGETRIELHFIIGTTTVVSRAAHLTFNPSTGALQLEDMREYTWENGGTLTVLSAAAGESLSGWSIASIEVKGY